MFDKLRSLLGGSENASSSSDGRRVNRVDGDPTGLLDDDPTGLLDSEPTGLFDDDEWFETVDVDARDVAGEAKGGADVGTAPRTPSVSPETARPGGDSPVSTDFPRGTFVLPYSVPFLQNLETRAQNGAHEVVETVYVLAGPTYTTPNVMFQLDDPELYESATPSSVTSMTRAMARRVAAAYDGLPAPKMIARVHTHPNGSTTPSDVDRTGNDRLVEIYRDELGTEDVEFFQGIHAFDRHRERQRDLDDRYEPRASVNGVSWHGSRFQHTLKLFDPHFRQNRPVEVLR
jgi:proteasome lid subunit RPN8/RPN11